MKTMERQRARDLRELGWSVKEIERTLGVARSSVSLWVRDVQLTPAARRRLVSNVTEGRLRAATRRADAARRLRADYQATGRRLARERGADYAAGCMLYWAEGVKGRNSAQMSNSDPALLAYFAKFLRSHFAVPVDKFSAYCNLFADHVDRQREIERFWLKTLGLPETCLRKSIVNSYSKYSQEARQQTPLRHVPSCGPQHAHRPNHLRLDPGVRRLRTPRVARLTIGTRRSVRRRRPSARSRPGAWGRCARSARGRSRPGRPSTTIRSRTAASRP